MTIQIKTSKKFANKNKLTPNYIVFDVQTYLESLVKKSEQIDWVLNGI